MVRPCSPHTLPSSSEPIGSTTRMISETTAPPMMMRSSPIGDLDWRGGGGMPCIDAGSFRIGKLKPGKGLPERAVLFEPGGTGVNARGKGPHKHHRRE